MNQLKEIKPIQVSKMNFIKTIKSKRILVVLAAFLAVSTCWAADDPTEITAETTTYTRTKGNGSWGTLCLPKQITKIEGATVWIPYYCAKSDGVCTGSLTLREVMEEEFPLPAGTPVMFKYNSGTTPQQITVTMPEEELITDKTTPSELSKRAYMVGNLSSTALTADKGNYVLIYTSGKDEVRYVATGSISIPQYRAYLDLGVLPATDTDAYSNLKSLKTGELFNTPQSVRVMTLDGETDNDETGLQEVLKSESTPILYDLSGRQVKDAAHGIFITNGKKVFKK